jgi:hypothetical protein
MRPLSLILAFGALAFSGGTSSLWAQEQKISCDAVPAPVRASFEKAYAKADMSSCLKETEKGKTSYEIDSKSGENRLTVRFQADGKVIRAEETIATADVPEPVKQAAQKKYAGGEIALAQKVTSGNAVTYELHVKHRNKTVEVAFDANGKEVKIKR